MSDQHPNLDQPWPYEFPPSTATAGTALAPVTGYGAELDKLLEWIDGAKDKAGRLAAQFAHTPNHDLQKTAAFNRGKAAALDGVERMLLEIKARCHSDDSTTAG